MEFTPLTADQRLAFDRDGYLVIKGALPPEMVERTRTAADRLYQAGLASTGLNPAGYWYLRNCLPADDVFLELLDWPTTVPLIAQLLNHNIQMITSHLVVRPPCPEGIGHDFFQAGWHRDGGTAFFDLGEAQPRMFIKVAYWLTDLSEPGRGSIRLLRGSNDTSVSAPIDGDEEHLEIRAQPGDAVLFENRTLHAVGPNLSDVTRMSVFFGYGYRWLRPMDYLAQPQDLLDRCDPIRRQLLGDCTDAMGYQIPQADDVPLKPWLADHIGKASTIDELPGRFFGTR